jgi:L-methionine (R)-S-oxide reductase
MAETTLDLRGMPREQAYAQLDAHIRAVLEGIDDDIAAMATIASLVHHAFGWLWTGFYRVVQPGALLRVGPYQGTLGCLEIQVGRGVCGTAAAERRTLVVPDVSEFPGHIACDARARSEIVIPVLDARGTLLAVLDVDSERLAEFGKDDRVGLERIVRWFAEHPGVSSLASERESALRRTE